MILITVIIEFNQIITSTVLLTLIVSISISVSVNIILAKKDSERRLEVKNRLRYYEDYLIDIKIKLEEIGIENEQKKVLYIKRDERVHSSNHNKQFDVTSDGHANKYVKLKILNLLRDKSLTSRDIQNNLKKSREHVARLMKKLHDEECVERNTNSKPYSYIITEEGKQKLGIKSN